MSKELLQQALDAKVADLMEQAQVFASTWASVDGPFDDGNTMQRAEDEKVNLEAAIRAAIAQQVQPEPVAQADCTRSHPHENMGVVCELRTVIARLENEKAHQYAAQAEPLSDSKRLEYLIDHRAYIVSDNSCADGYWLNYARIDGSTWVQIDEYATPRAAIDAAIAGTIPTIGAQE